MMMGAFRLNSDFRNLWYLKIILLLLPLALFTHGRYRLFMSNGTRKENADRVISRRRRALKSLPSDIITRRTAILRADDGSISVISLLDRTFYPLDIFFWGGIFTLWISFFAGVIFVLS